MRKIGEDIAEGERRGRRRARGSAPGELGLCAALGLAEVPVVRAPRVAIIATGDELVDVVDAARPEPDRRFVGARACPR